MYKVANFFTVFWMVYFPTCVAYNDLPGFSSVDEVMTVVILAFTFMQKGKKYVNSSTASNNDEKRRKKDIENAGKFSTDRIKPIEFEANRYAANHSSENAVKKALYSI